MVKNTKGGNKAKNQARKNYNNHISLKFNDIAKTEEQEYARVLKVFGSGRYELLCYDGITRLGISRGKINHRVKIKIDSIVLISKRDYQDNKCDILYTYNNDELNLLILKEEIKETFAKFSDGQNDNVKFIEEEIKFEDL